MHTVDIHVRFYELDPYRHVNHSAYIQYFETARIQLLEDIHLGLIHLEDRGYRIVVTSIETRFLKSAEMGDTLTVQTWVEDIRRATATWGQRILKDDEVYATQSVGAAILDLTGKPTRWLPEFEQAMTPFRIGP
ncbi:MAG: acyl-CoA thioesterase [Acidimicrobiia bacterium]|nr:acyl-CoA thioesterase [Acidimicrobiia bacterium]